MTMITAIQTYVLLQNLPEINETEKDEQFQQTNYNTMKHCGQCTVIKTVEFHNFS